MPGYGGPSWILRRYDPDEGFATASELSTPLDVVRMLEGGIVMLNAVVMLNIRWRI